MKRSLILLSTLLAILSLLAVSCETPEPEPEDSVKITPTTLTLPGDGGTGRLAVESNVSNLSCRSSETWLKATLEGMELVVEAEASNVLEPRTANVSVTGGKATATVVITQEAGSKYPGYTETVEVSADYSGGMMQKFYHLEDADGGLLNLSLTTADQRYTLFLEMFTEWFENADQVEIVAGNYTKGADKPAGSGYVARKMSWVPGDVAVITDADGTEEIQYGTWLEETIGTTSTSVNIKEGSILVEKLPDGVYLIKTDLEDENGEPVKFVYEGAIEINSDGAVFTGDLVKGDPTEFVSGTILYEGDSSEGVTHLTLSLYCAGNDGYPITSFSFYVPSVSFDSLATTDLSGSYFPADGETTKPGDAGTVDIGSSEEFMGMLFPVGSHIVFGMMNYFIPNGMVSLVLTRTTDGKYNVTGVMADADFEEFYMFMDEDKAIDIQYLDATDED